MTSVYITAPFSERPYAVEVMQGLEREGIEVTARWLKEDDTLSDEHARKDLDDVERADVLIALNPPGYENRGTGGRHVELGYALKCGKPVILIGERTNIFHYLKCVRVYSGEHGDYQRLAALVAYEGTDAR